eukprot:NODE_1740_length_858_cov_543.700865_g1371_i0.p1 GENE.NODE_1740_length_858_cov_543.700865_g1371_i0~~NODE_1740_length_858_cov_543.700865_g1371_i0.p1  ORF type:complete len:231 (+),score=38.83 NODE_1740_length_858_cov_543.700865_g1371_i0:66-758(+)
MRLTAVLVLCTLVAALGGRTNDCVDKVNEYRQARGLPLYSACTRCDSCMDTKANYHKNNGAHSAFTACMSEDNFGPLGGKPDMTYSEGDSSQNCVAWIISLMDRYAQTGVCEGHCGPIIANWPNIQVAVGEVSGYTTVNWGAKCDGWCDNFNRAHTHLNGGAPYWLTRQQSMDQLFTSVRYTNQGHHPMVWVSVGVFVVGAVLAVGFVMVRRRKAVAESVYQSMETSTEC